MISSLAWNISLRQAFANNKTTLLRCSLQSKQGLKFFSKRWKLNFMTKHQTTSQPQKWQRIKSKIPIIICGVVGSSSTVVLLHCIHYKGLQKSSCREVSKKYEKQSDIPFPFSDFYWKYLLPEMLPLTLAIVAFFRVTNVAALSISIISRKVALTCPCKEPNNAALCGALLNMKIPVTLGNLINLLHESIQDGAHSAVDYFASLKEPVLELIKLYILQGFASFAYISCLSHVGENIACKMRKDLFGSYLKQDVAFHDQHKTGLLIDRLTSDIQDFKSSFKLCVSQGLRSTTQTVGCVVGLYSISPKLTIALTTTIPLLVITGTLIGASLRRLSKKAQEYSANATAKANEVIANFRTVRAFANESYEEKKYEKMVSQSCLLNQCLGIGIGGFQGLTNIALNGVVLGVVYAGGFLVTNGEINSGQLMSFLVSAQMIQRSLSSLSVLFGTAVRGISAGARAFEFINLKPKHSIYGGRKIPYHCLMGHLQFHNVHFTYPHRPDQPVLTGVDLDIKPCMKVALVGLSGAGKSTLAGLAERFYEPNSGKITLDGVDIKDLDPSWLRGTAIGFINQEPVLFSGTIEENIRYGKHDATNRQVIQAAKLANAHDFISRFPAGYKTVVGERGLALSGGQKQRIAIARALLKNPSLLILDEATSALDAESERLVQEALDHVTQSRTTLIIAHRLSTIKNADLIAVIQGGKVVEIGKHEDLKNLNGIYAELIKLQESNR